MKGLYWQSLTLLNRIVLNHITDKTMLLYSVLYENLTTHFFQRELHTGKAPALFLVGIVKNQPKGIRCLLYYML
jgi:hypothetical protein